MSDTKWYNPKNSLTLSGSVDGEFPGWTPSLGDRNSNQNSHFLEFHDSRPCEKNYIRQIFRKSLILLKFVF